MAKLRIVAGILGILSLIIPWTIVYIKDPYGINIGLEWLPVAVSVFLPTAGHVSFYHSFVNSFGLVDGGSGVAGLILILAGSVVLLGSQNHPKLGGVLVLIGFFIMAADYGFDEIKYGTFTFIPIGMVLGIIGGVVGVAAKAPERVRFYAKEDPVEKLQKLKSLLDSGVITKDEFQSQKDRILEEMKRP